MNILEDLFNKAKKYGITRSDIGKYIWGEKNFRMVYLIKNPTIRTIQRLDKAINDLISRKKY